jgi:hypothetical protein
MYQWWRSKFTKDMFGSKPKAGLFFSPDPDRSWGELVLGPDPASRTDLSCAGGRVCSVLGVCSDPDQNQDVFVRIRTGAGRT